MKNIHKKIEDRMKESIGIPSSMMVASTPTSATSISVEDMLLAKKRLQGMFRPLRKLTEGTFIQTKLREPDSKYPPPIFYVGKVVKNRTHQIHDSYTMEEKRNLFCLHTLTRTKFDLHIEVLSEEPEVSEEMRLSIIPFLELEPQGDDPTQMFMDVETSQFGLKSRAMSGLYGSIAGGAVAGVAKPSQASALVTNISP